MTGTELKEMRARYNLSQAKLAEISGISPYDISAYELEKKSITKFDSNILRNVFNNPREICLVVNRKKRYTSEGCNKNHNDLKRREKAIRTEENKKYISILNNIWNNHISSLKKFNAISLFSGIGGLCLGFSAAGFSINGFVEINENLSSIYKKNFKNAVQIGYDIRDISDIQVVEMRNKYSKIDAIIGGPPCQGFSLAGKRNVSDPRNDLFLNYANFVDIIKPKVAILENVRQLLTMKSMRKTLIKDEIIDKFETLGYLTKFFEINAKDYGVPQHRERVFFIALRKDLNIIPSFPQRTHIERLSLISSLSPYRTFADACSDLPYIESGEKTSDELHFSVNHPAHVINWLWNVKQGCSAHDNEDPCLRPPSGYNTTYKRQIWNEPASTVQTTFGMISGCRNVHPIATRSLTIREAARIQSFPDQFCFVGNLGDIRTGIGNAVPPLLSYILAQHIIQILSR